MNRKRKISMGLLAALVVAGGLASPAGGASVTRLARWVLASGGSSTAGQVALRGALGQPVTGQSRGGTVSLSAGFWSGGVGAPDTRSKVFMPVVTK